jgi:hypothetical protein
MRLAPVAVALLSFGIPFAVHVGALGALAVVALAQGIGLAVALTRPQPDLARVRAARAR